MRKLYRCEEGFIEADAGKGVCWVNITLPLHDDIRYLTEEAGMPVELLEYLQDKDERPRIERQGEWLMTIIRIPIRFRGETMPYTTVPLGIISNSSDKVYTVCYHANRMLDDFAEHTRQKSICFDNVANFSLRILYSAAYWYLDYLHSITESVIGTEKDLRRTVQNDDLITLMRIQKSLVFFNTSVKGNSMVLERLQKIYDDTIDTELLEDVDIELRQADSTIDIYSNILEGTMDAYASIINNNVNSVMRRMSGLSIILIVPTFVASLYGMNVDILISGPHAFWIIIALAIVLTIIAFVVLRRLKWV